MVRGPGLFTGKPATLVLQPAASGTGRRFVQATGDETIASRGGVDGLVAQVDRQPRHTVLAGDGLRVETVEHLLAALAAYGVTDVEIRLHLDDGDGDTIEIPMGDGSSQAFMDAVAEAGIVPAGGEVEPLVIAKTVQVEADDGSDASLIALPGPTDALEVVYTFDAPAPIGRQVASVRIAWPTTASEGATSAFATELASARTFIFEHEANALKARGWGGHLTTKDLVVIGDDGPIDNAFRWPDEPVRHKVLDLVGDLALVGRPVCGRIIAHHSGHALNHKLARALLEADATLAPTPAAEPVDPADPLLTGFKRLLNRPADEAAMDIRRIQRLLPHRFPMLLIDRVLEMDGDSRAVGLKNVTMGDVFFLGHYPVRPIFPGVLIVEAMGQLGGILLSQKLEHTGKIAILLSMDGVKMRQPVTPGDQLVLVAEAVRVRSRTGQVRCQAFVADRLAAEADIKFMLADADSE